MAGLVADLGRIAAGHSRRGEREHTSAAGGGPAAASDCGSDSGLVSEDQPNRMDIDPRMVNLNAPQSIDNWTTRAHKARLAWNRTVSPSTALTSMNANNGIPINRTQNSFKTAVQLRRTSGNHEVGWLSDQPPSVQRIRIRCSPPVAFF